MPRTKQTCNLPDCDRTAIGRGLCGLHYYWLRGRNDENRILAERYATESSRKGGRRTKRAPARPPARPPATPAAEATAEATARVAAPLPPTRITRAIDVEGGSMLAVLETLIGDPPSLAEIRRQGGRIRQGAAEVLAALGVEILQTARAVQDAQRQLDAALATALATARAELAARASTEPTPA